MRKEKAPHGGREQHRGLLLLTELPKLEKSGLQLFATK